VKICGWVASLLFVSLATLADSTSNAAKVQVLFTPGDNIAETIVQTIRKAKQSVRVQCYSFTNKAIARALLDAQRRRIEVTVLADQEQFEKGAAFVLREFKEAGVTIKLDGSHSSAHNKVILVDDAGVNPKIITGSFNFTQAAQKYNAENIVIIHDDQALATAYRENWNRHWQHAAAFE
jgi:phosphatidylserine/phosphatidylglycerophosphate/cardiolipin synthase-like enzyme